MLKCENEIDPRKFKVVLEFEVKLGQRLLRTLVKHLTLSPILCNIFNLEVHLINLYKSLSKLFIFKIVYMKN